jgi:hypothetical protein
VSTDEQFAIRRKYGEIVRALIGINAGTSVLIGDLQGAVLAYPVELLCEQRLPTVLIDDFDKCCKAMASLGPWFPV